MRKTVDRNDMLTETSFTEKAGLLLFPPITLDMWLLCSCNHLKLPYCGPRSGHKPIEPDPLVMPSYSSAVCNAHHKLHNMASMIPLTTLVIMWDAGDGTCYIIIIRYIDCTVDVQQICSSVLFVL
jgi:hypothetical protein